MYQHRALNIADLHKKHLAHEVHILHHLPAAAAAAERPHCVCAFKIFVVMYLHVNNCLHAA
jgi:hypothetical protein